MNKKIYSDDFDMSSDMMKEQKRRNHNNGSLMECPISENVESENDDYLSDYSSFSNFSLKKKKMSFDLSRLIDKLEPQFDDSSSLFGKVYFSNVNETIKEEADDDL